MFDSFATLWNVACQPPLSMGFVRPEYWSGLPFPSMGDIPDPGIKPVSPVLAGRFFTTEPPGRLPLTSLQVLNKDQLGFPGWLRGKESACNAGDMDSILGSGRCLGGGHGHPLQYSCWENPMDRGIFIMPFSSTLHLSVSCT